MDIKFRELLKYIRQVGIEVNTSTKARGHQGFYLKNRIDISKNIPESRLIPTLLHEFTHYVHSKIEPGMVKTGGSLQVIFNTEDCIDIYKQELINVTEIVDIHAKCEKLLKLKQVVKSKILDNEQIIKYKYPKFMRSKKFKEFDKYIKHSNARFLLKHDRVKLVSGILFKKVEIFSIDNIERDFIDMPKEFVAYIRLKSCQKRQCRISARINRLKKYYSTPTELFARLVEGLYLYPEIIKNKAPNTYKKFFELLNNGYYPCLNEMFEIIYKPNIL